MEGWMPRYGFIRIVSLILVMAGLACGSAFAAGIRIVPSSTQVTPGDDFFFDVVAEGIPANGLEGVQFRLNLAPSSGAVTGVSDLSQAGANNIAVVTPLVVSPAVSGRSGIGDFFWNGKGPNGILVMDNETLTNGTGLYTFAHTSGATPPSGSGSTARFAVRTGAGITTERLEIGLSDVMLLDGGSSYPLEYTTGTTVQLRCMAKVPALLGMDRAAALAALTSARLVLGSIYEVNNIGGARPLNVVLEQSALSDSDLLCQTPVNLAINTPPMDVSNAVSIDKPNDESGAVLLSWTPSTSADSAGYRVHANGTLLKQIAGPSANGTEINSLANGVVTSLKVTVYDTFGNESAGTYVNALPLDDVPPVITISGIVAGSFSRLDATPQVTVTDAGPVTWSATLNGAPFTIAPITVDGAHTLTVSAVDKAGNSAVKTVAFSIDKSAPVISVTGVTDGAYYNSPVFPLVTISDTNLKTSSITMDGQAYTSGSKVAEAGSHTLLATAEDQAGSTTSRTVRFTIDTVPPMLTVSTLTNNSYTNNNILNVSGTASDDQSGVKELKVNGTTVPVQPDNSFSQALVLADGANTITVDAIDQAGNQTSDSRTITLDQKSPILVITAPADNSKTATALATISGTVDETSTVSVTLGNNIQTAVMNGTTFTADLNLVPGINTIEVVATDLAGNTGSQKRTIIYDDQKPSLAITIPAQDIRTNLSGLTISGSASDIYTAVTVSITMDNQTYTPTVVNDRFEQAVTFTTEKSYALVVTATNEAGSSTTAQRNVIYDITAPAFSIDPVTSPTTQPDQVISGAREAAATVTVTCATATVGMVEYPTATTWRTALSALTTGDNILIATATDAAGNIATLTAHIQLLTSISSLKALIGELVKSGALPAYTAAALKETLAKALNYYNSNKIKLGDIMMNSFIQQVNAAKNSGRISPATASLLVNAANSVIAAYHAGSTHAPILTITSPADNSVLADSSVTITGTVDKAATVKATVNGGTAQSAVMNGNNFTITLNLAKGTNTIAVSASDSAGNSATVKRTVVSDTTKPTLIITDPAQDITTSQAVLTLSGTATDTVTAVTVTITCDGKTYTPQVVQGTFRQQLSFAAPKQYAITVTATDRAGNSVTTPRNVTYAVSSLPSGDINGDGRVDIVDAQLALMMAMGMIKPTPSQLAAGDVAPLVNGKPAPNGVIDFADAMAILGKMIGLVTW